MTTTTPTIWKPKFIPNLENAAGTQQRPQSVGLSNGNILVVWDDDTFGSDPGIDIIGRIFDPLGNPVGPQFQLNVAGPAYEAVPKIAAMPNGGFVLALRGYDDSSLSVSSGITVYRFDNAGNPVAGRFISVPFSSTSSSTANTNSPFDAFEVAVNHDGDYVVVFEREVPDQFTDGDDLNVHARVYNRVTNDPGAEHTQTAQNDSRDDDNLAAIDTFANGNIITLTNERDTAFDILGGVDIWQSVEIRITTATGAPVHGFVQLAGEDTPVIAGSTSAYANDVAVLAGGRFVALYHVADENPHIGFKIGTVTASGITVGPEKAVTLYTGPSAVTSLVALQDGGFFVAWIRDGVVRGTRYQLNASDPQQADVVGEHGFIIATGAATDAQALGHLSLTTDGRILVPFRDASGDIAEVILDPRETTINGTASDDTLTSQTTGSIVFGQGGSDRIYGGGGEDILHGQGGNDTITGGDSSDGLQGGGENDSLYGDGGNDFLFGEAGSDFLDGGVGNDQLNGDAGIDTLVGGLGDDTLNGGADNDTLNGNQGIDTLAGGTGNDTYVLDTVHQTDDDGLFFIAYDQVTEAADPGVDTVQVSRVTGIGNPTTYILPTNVENGIVTGALAFNLVGNGAANQLTGNAAANTLNGLGDNDTIGGGGGNDTLNGGAGNDTLDGGPGFDTAVFAGNRSAFTVTRSGATTTVTGPDGIDTLVAVERLQFTDATVPIDPTRNDFNGDGRTDVLFRQVGQNFDSNYQWQLNNRALLAQGAVDLFDKSFTVQVVGDYDGDGKADVLFENPSTGGVWEWLLDGTIVRSQGAVDVADPSFHLLGAGDFNGDGRDDVLFRNDAGFIYQWQMNGLVNTPLAVGPLDPSWHVQGTGDFNGDGRDDILLRNISAAPNENGAFFLWQMNGNVVESQGGIERPPTTWKTLGIGDFDGDGKDDFAVRNVSATPDNGAVWVYLMNGVTIKSQGAAGIADAATWKLQQIGDLDGDGKDDILYRNDAGYFYSWNMNGTTIASEGLLQGAAQHADPSFTVVKPFWDLV